MALRADLSADTIEAKMTVSELEGRKMRKLGTLPIFFSLQTAVFTAKGSNYGTPTYLPRDGRRNSQRQSADAGETAEPGQKTLLTAR